MSNVKAVLEAGETAGAEIQGGEKCEALARRLVDAQTVGANGGADQVGGLIQVIGNHESVRVRHREPFGSAIDRMQIHRDPRPTAGNQGKLTVHAGQESSRFG